MPALYHENLMQNGVKGWSLGERWSFTISAFILSASFMMPYRLIPLISALKEFKFFVAVGPSIPFGPVQIHRKLRISGGTWMIWFLGSLKSPKPFRELWKHLKLDFSKIFSSILDVIGIQPLKIIYVSNLGKTLRVSNNIQCFQRFKTFQHFQVFVLS